MSIRLVHRGRKKMNKKYLAFSKTGETAKTKIFGVYSTAPPYSDKVGEVRWHWPWRKYCFFTNGGTIFDNNCLQEITNFLDEENKKHREKQKVKIPKFIKTIELDNTPIHGVSYYREQRLYQHLDGSYFVASGLEFKTMIEVKFFESDEEGRFESSGEIDTVYGTKNIDEALKEFMMEETKEN